jgi:hypothetical protein
MLITIARDERASSDQQPSTASSRCGEMIATVSTSVAIGAIYPGGIPRL